MLAWIFDECREGQIPRSLHGYLTLLIAFMEITGIPSAFFVHIQAADIEPVYFTLMVNFLLIGAAAYLFLRTLCSAWDLLLNLMEKILVKSKNSTLLAVVLSSVIFGAGHIFGLLNQPLIVIVSKVV